jgi:hypothetical protein
MGNGVDSPELTVREVAAGLEAAAGELMVLSARVYRLSVLADKVAPEKAATRARQAASAMSAASGDLWGGARIAELWREES